MSDPSRALAVGVLGLGPTAAVAPKNNKRPHRPTRVLLINVHDRGGSGLAVLAVSWFSPTRNMARAGNPWQRGALERGDIITHINGQRIEDVQTLQEELNRSKGSVTLTVVDCRSGAPIAWRVKPAPVGPLGPFGNR
jgi:S1-C subfamily serine protease